VSTGGNDLTSPDSPVRPEPRLLVVIALGGAVGSAARYGVEEALSAAFPWATAVVNVVGGFLLGLLVAGGRRPGPGRRYQQAFWGAGVLAGFTTFSTVMVDVLDLAGSGRPVTAFGYLGTTLVCGFLCAWVGLVVGRRTVSGRADHQTGRRIGRAPR
jgi:fluoride exporter